MNNPETWKNGKKKGSITAEASIALSLFLLFFLLMIYFYLLLNLEMNMQNAIENAADMQVVSSMAPEEIRLNTVSVQLNTVFLKQYVIAELGADYLNSCWIRGGGSGLYFGKSRLEEEADEIRVVVSYYIRIPFWGLRDIQIVQSAVRRKWIGADSSSMEGQVTGTSSTARNRGRATAAAMIRVFMVWHLQSVDFVLKTPGSPGPDPRWRSPATGRPERRIPHRRTARAGSWRSAARRWGG